MNCVKLDMFGMQNSAVFCFFFSFCIPTCDSHCRSLQWSFFYYKSGTILELSAASFILLPVLPLFLIRFWHWGKQGHFCGNFDEHHGKGIFCGWRGLKKVTNPSCWQWLEAMTHMKYQKPNYKWTNFHFMPLRLNGDGTLVLLSWHRSNFMSHFVMLTVCLCDNMVISAKLL